MRKKKIQRNRMGQSGKTLTIEKCTDADYVVIALRYRFLWESGLYTYLRKYSFNIYTPPKKNPTLLVNNKGTGYGKMQKKDDADGNICITQYAYQ